MKNKLRSVNTRFWDDPFIEELKPEDKLLFLYLLTNPQTTLLGIYEITMKRISYDTGLKYETIRKGFESFQKDKKAFFTDDNYIIMPNWLKNQNLNSNMKKAIVKEFTQLPKSVKDSILRNGFEGLGNDSEGFRIILESLSKYEIEIESEIEIEKEESLNISFSVFWDLYNKKVGDRNKCEKKWKNLNNDSRQKIIDSLPSFLSTIKDKQFQPYPETYLNQQRWNDEVKLSAESKPVMP